MMMVMVMVMMMVNFELTFYLKAECEHGYTFQNTNTTFVHRQYVGNV